MSDQADLEIHKLMHLLCIRAGVIKKENSTHYFWVEKSTSEFGFCYCCMLCRNKIRKIEFLNHGKFHLKEHNLLPFI